jgi:hypothetical protein
MLLLYLLIYEQAVDDLSKKKHKLIYLAKYNKIIEYFSKYYNFLTLEIYLRDFLHI